MTNDHLRILHDHRKRANGAAACILSDGVIEALDAAIATLVALPVTADGVLVVPGDKVWCIRTVRVEWVGERGTASYRGEDRLIDADEPMGCKVASMGCIGGKYQRFRVIRGGMSFCEATLPEWCYSTKAAAEAAMKKASE